MKLINDYLYNCCLINITLQKNLDIAFFTLFMSITSDRIDGMYFKELFNPFVGFNNIRSKNASTSGGGVHRQCTDP